MSFYNEAIKIFKLGALAIYNAYENILLTQFGNIKDMLSVNSTKWNR